MKTSEVIAKKLSQMPRTYLGAGGFVIILALAIFFVIPGSPSEKAKKTAEVAGEKAKNTLGELQEMAGNMALDMAMKKKLAAQKKAQAKQKKSEKTTKKTTEKTQKPVRKAPSSQSLAFKKFSTEITDLMDSFEFYRAHEKLTYAWKTRPQWRTALRPQIGRAVQEILFSPIPWRESDMYHVQKGDTLYGLSRKYEIPLVLLAQLNSEQNPGELRVGERIKILQGPVRGKVKDKTFHLYLGSTWMCSYPVTQIPANLQGKYQLHSATSTSRPKKDRPGVKMAITGPDKKQFTLELIFDAFPMRKVLSLFPRGTEIQISPTRTAMKENEKSPEAH